MGEENSIQLSVQMLGCILIAKETGVEYKQMQRLSEFVDSVNSIFPHWQYTHCHLWATPGLGQDKVQC